MHRQRVSSLYLEVWHQLSMKSEFHSFLGHGGHINVDQLLCCHVQSAILIHRTQCALSKVEPIA